MQLGLRKILSQNRKRLSSYSKAAGPYEVMKDAVVNPASLNYRKSMAQKDRRQIRSLMYKNQTMN